MPFGEDLGFVTADKLENAEIDTVPSENVEVIETKSEIIETETDNDMIVVENEENLPDYTILNPDIPMSVKVGVATNVANTLSTVIRKQGLVVNGLNKKNPEAEYVLIEGWEILGTMLGITPVTKIVEPMENSKGRTIGYRASATLLRNPMINEKGEIVGGDVLSVAEGCADKSGYQSKNFSMMSMAQTRALGKAYRMTLSWIMKLAGYEPTPAEEMEDFR